MTKYHWPCTACHIINDWWLTMIVAIVYDSDGNNYEDDYNSFEASEGNQDDTEGVTVGTNLERCQWLTKVLTAKSTHPDPSWNGTQVAFERLLGSPLLSKHLQHKEQSQATNSNPTTNSNNQQTPSQPKSMSPMVTAPQQASLFPSKITGRSPSIEVWSRNDIRAFLCD